MSFRNIIVIGASAGGIEALREIVAGLPRDFRASVFVVVHTSPDSPGILGEILDRVGTLPAANAFDGERIHPGRLYVAPPDHHLLVEPGKVRVTRGPKENRFRPAVDPLFRSAAQVYGPRAVGVILTGGLDDGTAGLWAVKQLGGTTIVQDPEDALIPSMPDNAMRHVNVDYCLPLAEIAPALVRLTTASIEEEGGYRVSEEMEIEIRIAKEERAIAAGVMKLGEPSTYACPECHGVLLQLKKENPLRFRCHTGHAYTADSLLADMTKGVGDSLWSAIRSIEESALLMRHIAGQLSGAENARAAEHFLGLARAAERRADTVRQAAFSSAELNTERVERSNS